jgi:WD40 repeat protein
VEEELIIKEECRVAEQKFQAIVYTSNIYGSDIESDVITGSAEGDIGLYVCGSFLFSHKKAHDRGITCLRLAELFQYKRVLISGGGDGYVRIWDIKFNEISRRNIR